MQKRIICLLLIVAMVMSFSGCGIIDRFLKKNEPSLSVNTDPVPTSSTSKVVLADDIPEAAPMFPEFENWSSETHALVMLNVDTEIGRMVDFTVTFYGKMGDVYVMTDEPVEIPAGDYTVVIEADDYLPHREEITIEPGEQIFTDIDDFDLFPVDEALPFSSGTIVTVGDKAYYCDVGGIYCINAETKVDELGKGYVSPETTNVYTGDLPPFASIATNGIMVYVADINGVIIEIDLVSGITRELTEALGEGTYVCGADMNGVFVSPYFDYNLEENWTVYGKISRISLNTGEIEYTMNNVRAICANGYTCLQGLSGGVDPNGCMIYDYAGDLVLELDMVWNVSSMGDKLCISQAIDLTRSFRVVTYGEGGLQPIYEVELLDNQSVLSAVVCGGMLNYYYYDEISNDMVWCTVDLYSFEDITGVYPELGEYPSIIYLTGDFKYYCTIDNAYLAGPGFVFPIHETYTENGYYSYFFVNGCVIEFDSFNLLIKTFAPPVA